MCPPHPKTWTQNSGIGVTRSRCSPSYNDDPRDMAARGETERPTGGRVAPRAALRGDADGRGQEDRRNGRVGQRRRGRLGPPSHRIRPLLRTGTREVCLPASGCGPPQRPNSTAPPTFGSLLRRSSRLRERRLAGRPPGRCVRRQLPPPLRHRVVSGLRGNLWSSDKRRRPAFEPKRDSPSASLAASHYASLPTAIRFVSVPSSVNRLRGPRSTVGIPRWIATSTGILVPAPAM